MVNQRSREPLICVLLLTSVLASPSFAAGKRWSSKGQPGPSMALLEQSSRLNRWRLIKQKRLVCKSWFWQV